MINKNIIASEQYIQDLGLGLLSVPFIVHNLQKMFLPMLVMNVHYKEWQVIWFLSPFSSWCLAIGRTLIPRYFRSIFEGGATELYYVLKHPKESFHNNFVSLDCDQCTMVTQHGKPMFTQVRVQWCFPSPRAYQEAVVYNYNLQHSSHILAKRSSARKELVATNRIRTKLCHSVFLNIFLF